LARKINFHINVLTNSLTRFIYQFPDAYVCYVDDAFDILESYGIKRDKVFITYNSPDTDNLLSIYESIRDEGQMPGQKHRLIHVGRLVRTKRLDLLLKATAILRKKYPDVELFVVADGPQRQEWESLAESFGIRDIVKFLGGGLWS